MDDWKIVIDPNIDLSIIEQLTGRKNDIFLKLINDKNNKSNLVNDQEQVEEYLENSEMEYAVIDNSIIDNSVTKNYPENESVLINIKNSTTENSLIPNILLTSSEIQNYIALNSSDIENQNTSENKDDLPDSRLCRVCFKTKMNLVNIFQLDIDQINFYCKFRECFPDLVSSSSFSFYL